MFFVIIFINSVCLLIVDCVVLDMLLLYTDCADSKCSLFSKAIPHLP